MIGLTNRMQLISFKEGELFEKVILEGLLQARDSLLIGTYNLQDIRIESGTHTTSLSEVLIRLVKKGVKVLICLTPFMQRSRFIQTLRQNPLAREKILIHFCRRMHFKTIIVDLNYAYIGTANLSGAGVGLKSIRKRNFELGFITEKHEMIATIAETFLEIFNGKYCNSNKCHFFENYRLEDPCFGMK